MCMYGYMYVYVWGLSVWVDDKYYHVTLYKMHFLYTENIFKNWSILCTEYVLYNNVVSGLVLHDG